MKEKQNKFKKGCVNYINEQVLEVLNKADNIELESLESYPINLISSGVYFLKQNDVLVYIGCSSNISTRIIEHVKMDKKEFNNYSFFCVPEEEMKIIERYLINKFLPKYNCDSLTKIMR